MTGWCVPITAEANGPKGMVAKQFMAEVNRILEEGTARQESNQEMTGKIVHVASLSNLASLDSQEGTRKSSDLSSQR